MLERLATVEMAIVIEMVVYLPIGLGQFNPLAAG